MSNPHPQNQFKKGDARINRKGRPKSFDGLRALTQIILHEKVTSKDGTIAMSRLEMILREMAASHDPKTKQWLVEVGFGKVPQAVELSGKDGEDLVIEVTVKPNGD